jgi:hypothetical protein
MKHVKDKYPECILAEGRSLLEMGFTRASVKDGRNSPELLAVDNDSPSVPDLLGVGVVHRTPDLFLALLIDRNTPTFGSRAPILEVLAIPDETEIG